MKNSDCVAMFLGTVNATASKNDSTFSKYKGVVVNAASCTKSVNDFVDNIKKYLEHHELKLVEVTDIEEFDMLADFSSPTKSLCKTFNRAKRKKSTEFDIFYTYD